jgi:hypothetical protein
MKEVVCFHVHFFSVYKFSLGGACFPKLDKNSYDGDIGLVTVDQIDS